MGIEVHLEEILKKKKGMYSCNAAKREHPPPTSLYKREVHGETFILLFRLLKMNKANHFLVFHAAYSDGRSS